MIIVLEGIDGAGKSTLAPLVVERLRAYYPKCAFESKSSCTSPDPLIDARMRALASLIWENHPSSDVFGPEHWIQLIAAWYSALDRLCLRSIQRENRLAVFDGWYFRNITKTMLRVNREADSIFPLFEHITPPDLTVFVDIEPALAFKRGKFSPIEVGRWDGHEGSDEEAYIAYQRRIRAILGQLALREDWARVEQDGAKPEVLADRIVAMCVRRGLDVRDRPLEVASAKRA